MKNIRISICFLSLILSGISLSFAQLTTAGTFNPATIGGLCSIGFDPTSGNLWVYPCSGTSLYCYSSTGTLLATVLRPGEVANDVDLFFTTAPITLGATLLPGGTLLFINGETGNAEVYAVDKVTGAILATLNTQFGVSHVVGGGYDPISQHIFLIQDKVPGSTNANLIAEINTVTGAVINSFQITGTYSVNYGDLEVSPTGNIYLVSSDEGSIAEFSSQGVLLNTFTLPVGISNLSGIGLDCANEQAWVSSSSPGAVTQLNNLLCGVILPMNLLGFHASQVEEGVLLDWTSKSESYNLGFEIEHSANGSDWNYLGFTDEYEQEDEHYSYTYIHTSPSSTNYYRLKQTDIDGRIEYSDRVAAFFRNGDEHIQLFPTPTQSILRVVGLPPARNLAFEVTDGTGRVLIQSVFSTEQIDISKLSSGVYYLHIRRDGKIIYNSKIIKE